MTRRHELPKHWRSLPTIRRCTSAALLLAVVGCAQPPATLYQWERFPQHIDARLRPSASLPISDQTAQLSADLEKIQSETGKVPPGMHAHLGLLYAEQGQLDRFGEQLTAEKDRFPESTTFMDFLLHNLIAQDSPCAPSTTCTD